MRENYIELYNNVLRKIIIFYFIFTKKLDLSSDVIFLMAQALLPDMDQKALELEEINVEAGKTKNNQPAKVEEEEE